MSKEAKLDDILGPYDEAGKALSCLAKHQDIGSDVGFLVMRRALIEVYYRRRKRAEAGESVGGESEGEVGMTLKERTRARLEVYYLDWGREETEEGEDRRKTERRTGEACPECGRGLG